MLTLHTIDRATPPCPLCGSTALRPLDGRRLRCDGCGAYVRADCERPREAGAADGFRGPLLDPATERQRIADHHARCEPCRRLYAYARDRGDGEALAAWRRQLAEHITADAERDAYRREVLAWLGVRPTDQHGSRDHAGAQIVHENGDSRRRP